MFRGTYTALITPFTHGGDIDEKALRNLVELQITNGISGLVPVGTTGESPTLTHEEHTRIIKIVLDQARGRVPVIAGTGSNSTQEAIELTSAASELGAAASLQVAPYYNKPSQTGFFHHFTEIANAVSMPMILYNIPGRTGKAIATDTILSLSKHENIVGIKDATGNINDAMYILSQNEKICVLSGDDNLSLALIALGGHGVISVASNVIPKELSSCIENALHGEIQKAKKYFYAMLPLMNALLTTESNPVPVKYLASELALCKEVYRLPLYALTEVQKHHIKSAFETYKNAYST